MSDSAEPRFQWGQPVWAMDDLINDGSFPGLPEGALVVPAGQRGEVVRVGAHVESQTTVYLVEFPGDRVVGCLDDELSPDPVETTESQTP
jgi:nitrogen fixation protein NifZ